MIKATSGKPGLGMTYATCTPPAINGEPLRVAPSGKPGPGACINQNPLGNANRDLTGLRTVKRGCVVRFASGLETTVTRTRAGHFWHSPFGLPVMSFSPCSAVRVIA